MSNTSDFTINVIPEAPDAGYQAEDDLRHRPLPGGKMRDSLFWEMIMPDEKLGFQAYLYLAGTGQAGFNVIVWGEQEKPYVLELGHGEVSDDMDFDNFQLQGLSLSQPELRKTACLRYESDKVKLEYQFTALHDAFSFRQNPQGLPKWFALNRFEQTGHVKGFLEFDGRRIEWDRIGHRDHSWGTRQWGVPHHWKWLIAYSPDGRHIVNGWIYIAKGEIGFAGYVVKDGDLLPIDHIKHHADYDDDMGQMHLEADIIDTRGGVTHLEMDRFALVRLPTNDKMDTMIMEAACHAKIDGHAAAGQFETHWPKSYIEYLSALNKKS
ncbi:hypothetical protein IMCC21906_00553 [Spongiibacter sp. IMCC21906]|jgi:hypothetical protein|uniref:DUF7064 domain-containing protein n=1 Tax=Spongiibacter sp. IMCC21906 TaxID=1620392 RepID=UPI00062DFFB6|nr:hypothetical protein [Spongiibacter sp. IMCC21906]AKH68246.1 hypothetical protein IMCC21906_00553 [Spongiibacter sp. IMCC21906]